MKLVSVFLVATFCTFVSGHSYGQRNESASKNLQSPPQVADARIVRSSAAYSEVLLRETELKAELESLLFDYTEDYPKVKEIRSELELLSSESDRLLAIRPSDGYKLSVALGKLVLGKVANQTRLRQLRLQYADDHPNVRRQRRKVEVYEAAIKQILE